MISVEVSEQLPEGENPLKELPDFATYEIDLASLRKQVEPVQQYQHIILIAHGGSRTSFFAMHHAFPKKKVLFVATNDEQYLQNIEKQTRKEDTVVLAISKSGANITILESLLFFKDYPTVVVTENDTPLAQLAKQRGWQHIVHAPIGGRFSGFTSSAVVPALLTGINVEEMLAGAKDMYAVALEQNPALTFARFCFEKEQQGFTEVFVPCYVQEYTKTLPLIVQLMHETVCKEEKGQTFFGDEAPESQHHTNQRLFGGRKNILVCFVTRKEKQGKHITLSEKEKSIPLKEHTLALLDGITYEQALHAEFQGTWQDAVQKGIPAAHIELDDVSPRTLGEYIAFWQLVAVYAALLRNVNPFDQPQVEASKRISLKERIAYATKKGA